MGLLVKMTWVLFAANSCYVYFRLPLVNGTAREGDAVVSMCPDMPSTLAVDIMYTTLPEPSPDGYRFYRISGVRIG
jgi:hypothetical protein